MTGAHYRVSAVARLTGVTVRALHHYDEIGLLVPSRRSGKGYRLYTDDDLLRLQQIVIGRALGMSLERIRRSLDDPNFELREALAEQRALLVERFEQTEKMIRSIDAALAALDEKQEREMDAKQMFDGFDPAQYEDEARARWGSTEAYAESQRRTSKYGPEDWARMQAEAEAIVSAFAEALRAGVAAEDAQAIALAERHRLHIDRWFYACDRAMHARLAELYVGDERFAASFDRHGEGVALYVAAAIRANAARANAG
ncbi:MAG TPA: MerR family transcriptional regulator [Enhygromyxa sp.]|nr:MerR family transcriptional regulator [Enhygromyxa sp.]